MRDALDKRDQVSIYRQYADLLGEEGRATRDERLELVTQLLVCASGPAGWTSPGHVAVDATFIDANSRPEHTLRRRQIAKAA